jgi:Tfp pilus assembly protein PilF
MTPESKKRFTWVLVLLALGAVAAGLAAGPLLRAYHQYTARQDVAQARMLLGQRDYEGALEAARRAYGADPLSPDVVRTVAQVYREIDPAKAESFWEKAFELSDDHSDLGNWISTALKAGDYDTARKQLDVMAARGQTDSAYYYYRGRVQLRDQDLTGALVSARQALAQVPADDRAHFFFVQLTQLSDDPALRKEGMDYLWRLARQRDQLGLRSLRNLANFSANTDGDRLQIIRMLEEHPLATREDRLLALRLGYQLSTANAVSNLEKAKRYFDLTNPLDLARLGRWLNQQGRYQQTLDLIPADEAFARKDLFLVRLDAMAELGQWSLIGQVIQRPNAPVDEFLKYLFLSRVYFETGRRAEGEITWDRAVLEASRDDDKLWYLVNYALRLDLKPEAAKALWRLTEFPAQKRRACEQLLKLTQLEHDTAGMQKVLRLMAESYPDNLSVLNDWAYVNLLLDKQVQLSLKTAQKVVRESPRPYLARYVTLALAEYRMGEFEQALNTLRPLEVNWLETPAKWRVIYAAILRANGYTSDAARLLRGVNPADLLPEELALARLSAPAS